ncbi:zinc finger cchc domain-containing protein 7 [Plasmopara halstedii]|uniref:Zinc finger cchc domain-containing protein 7 n=1 Tax=Plasmopara halstedii TaxID=4781 RepID=A0A0P1A6Y1_PLAHL|nr:zinc finger cchc domain-containing protein 7 [Plasmopara halstedii]CEG35998.1 zinc finger cchc domain-containing protein 7 [Plasmopara halstedii]|eukprot:XP_024572367.1 zinc finger cchc domain-containing protein 7 [Plasmopara halstedii]
MPDENAGVLDAFSDVSESSDSDEEPLHIMDPSDPRAHRPAPSVVQPTRIKTSKTLQTQMPSRWDSDNDVGEPITVDLHAKNQKNGTVVVVNDDAKENPKKKSSVTLSKWAQARFLVPASQRKLPVVEESTLEPLNDFILSDFSSRYRGGTGNVKVEKEITAEEKVEHKISSKMQVGAPLFGTNLMDAQNNEKKNEATENKSKKKKKKEDGRKRKENRYFVTDLATKCFHCGEVGHIAGVCSNDKLQPPCYYCALRGHQAWECPNLPCANCLQLGHQENTCNKRTANLNPCGICGRQEHDGKKCDNVGDPAALTCMFTALTAREITHWTNAERTESLLQPTLQLEWLVDVLYRRALSATNLVTLLLNVQSERMAMTDVEATALNVAMLDTLLLIAMSQV